MVKRTRVHGLYARGYPYKFGPISIYDERIPAMYKWCQRLDGDENIRKWIYYIPLGRRGVREFAFLDEDEFVQFKLNFV